MVNGGSMAAPHNNNVNTYGPHTESFKFYHINSTSQFYFYPLIPIPIPIKQTFVKSRFLPKNHLSDYQYHNYDTISK